MNNKKHTLIIFGIAFVLLLVLVVVILLEGNNSPTYKGISPEEYQDKAQTNIVQVEKREWTATAKIPSSEIGEGGLQVFANEQECQSLVDEYNQKAQLANLTDEWAINDVKCEFIINDPTATKEPLLDKFIDILDEMIADQGDNNAPTTPARNSQPAPTQASNGRIKWEIAMYENGSNNRFVYTNAQFDTKADCERELNDRLSGKLAENGAQSHLDQFHGFVCEEMWWTAD